MSTASAGLPDPAEVSRSDFAVLALMTTRWRDEDVYGHVNNVVHYELFDTAVNGWLIQACGRDIRTLPAVGLVVETACRYGAELRFPRPVTAGVGLERAGRSSVVYRLALFDEGSEQAAATGRFVHVYVDRDTRRPVELPAAIRAALEGLSV